MKKHVIDIEEAKHIYVVFFKHISQNKIKKMQEKLDGFSELTEHKNENNELILINNEYMIYKNNKIYDNGINYARINSNLRPLKIMLFFCYNDCGSKFLEYFNGVNQRQYCKKCSNIISNFEDGDL